MNPLVARTIKWMDAPFISSIYTAVGVLLAVIVLTLFANSSAIVREWVILLGGIIVLTPTFFAVTAARFTEQTIHEGFYDMVVMSMTDREIVLGHVLLTFLHRRNIFAAIIVLLPAMVVVIPLYVIKEATDVEAGIPTMLASLGLIVGAGGLYLLAAVVGVAVSLRWGNQMAVFTLAIVGYLALSLLCAWLAVSSFEVVAMRLNTTGNAPFGLVVGSFYFIVSMLTWGYDHTVINAMRVMAAFVSMTLLVLVIGDRPFVWIVIGVMLFSGFFLMIMDRDPSDGISPSNRAVSALPQLGVVALTVTLLITHLSDPHDRDYTVSVLGLTVVMLLPYFLAVGLMALAERWTERPVQQHYNS
ncbi:MAG: hypothetical protein L0154_15190 [Chloroflexi bacterium]|nr:hypothetical protein [Chloroflexota bacterium]